MKFAKKNFNFFYLLVLGYFIGSLSLMSVLYPWLWSKKPYFN